MIKERQLIDIAEWEKENPKLKGYIDAFYKVSQKKGDTWFVVPFLKENINYFTPRDIQVYFRKKYNLETSVAYYPKEYNKLTFWEKLLLTLEFIHYPLIGIGVEIKRGKNE